MVNRLKPKGDSVVPVGLCEHASAQRGWFGRCVGFSSFPVWARLYMLLVSTGSFMFTQHDLVIWEIFCGLLTKDRAYYTIVQQRLTEAFLRKAVRARKD